MDAVAMDLQVKRLAKFDGEGSLRGFCDVAVGNLFLIRGLRIIQGKNGLFTSMPSQQGKDGKWYDVVRPLSKDVKAEMDRVVLAAYEHEQQIALDA